MYWHSRQNKTYRAKNVKPLKAKVAAESMSNRDLNFKCKKKKKINQKKGVGL